MLYYTVCNCTGGSGVNYKNKCSSMHTAGEYMTPTVQL